MHSKRYQLAVRVPLPPALAPTPVGYLTRVLRKHIKHIVLTFTVIQHLPYISQLPVLVLPSLLPSALALFLLR